MVKEKHYHYKVYTVSGTQSTFRGTWNDVIGYPQFEANINNGISEILISLARNFSDFGEGADVANGNLVKIYVSDTDSGDDDALLLASGYISGYTPVHEQGIEERVDVTILGNGVRLQDAVLTASGNTVVTFNSVDPSSILQSILNLYNTTVSGAISFGSTIDYTGTTVSYDFEYSTYRQALEKILELAPSRWFYRIDPDDTITFQARRYDPDHRLVVGRNINRIEPFKNIEDIVNVVYFVGDGIQSVYRNSSSIILYGEKSHVIEDRRVSLQTSADAIANRYLNDHANPETRVKLVVVDNNSSDPDRGYDIESFKVGQVVSIIHPDLQFERTKWDEANWVDSYWDGPIASVLSEPMQIVRITYLGTTCTLELSNRSPEVAKRIEDINRNLKDFIQATLTT